MPLKFEVKKKLISRSERVKSVELHPDLPWVLVGLFSGNITIYDHSNQTTVKTIEVSQSPVRTARFIARKQLLVAGSDDLMIRVFNYNTMEKIKQFEAHSDYIRYMLVHPHQPYLLTSSDDAKIKLWDMDNNFNLIRVLEDHIHYVMMLSLNPRDSNTFASASLDKNIKVWTLQTTNTKANFTLCHQAPVNCVDYFKGDKPYLISGGDDRLIKIWDYQTKQLVHTLEGHQQNISAATFHPELPIIISTAEDGAIRFWHSQTYKLETTLNYNMERIWCLDISKDSSNLMAFGFDDGTVVVKIGSDEPVVSMNSGKVVYAKNMEFFTINLKAINFNDMETLKDGSNMQTNYKELGMSDIYPIGVSHSPNGHLFGIYSDQEYSIYRSQTFKNAGFGQGTDLVWSPSGDYAVRDAFSLKIFKGANNALQFEIKTDYIVEQLFGGVLLGARSSDFIIFYHWETTKVIRKIDVCPKKVYWNDLNNMIALATNESIFFLQFQNDQMIEFLNRDEEAEGIEEAFDFKEEVNESVTSGIWISSVFYFTSTQGRLCYTINGEVFVIDTEKKNFIIGYIQAQNRLYLIDKFFAVSSYEINYYVSEFQSLVSKNEIQKALSLLEDNIPQNQYDKLSKFLDQTKHKDLAYQITKDPEHKFDLAIQLGKVEDAFKLVQEKTSMLKYRQVGDLALSQGKIEIAIQALNLAEDLSGLFLIFSSLGLKDQLKQVGEKAFEKTKMNIAFQCFFTLGDIDKCHEILIASKRFTEATFFAKTYCPSKIQESVKLWKASLSKSHPIISQKIADPFDFPDQFKDLDLCLQIENFYRQERQTNDVPAHYYQQYQDLLNFDIFQMIKDQPDYELSQFTLQPDNISYVNPLFDVSKLQQID